MPLSADYKHESSCSLMEPDHWIPDEFVEVLETAASKLEKYEDAVGETCVAAAGCGSCFHSDADVAFFWVAQNDMGEIAHVNYGHSDEISLGFSRLMNALRDAASEHDIPISTPDSDSFTVVLGVDNYYEDLEPGTLVEKPRRYGRGKRGIVIDPDAVNERMDFTVFDQDDYDGSGARGEVLGEFADRESAEAFAETQDCETSVRSIIKHGTHPGDNLVAWEGSSRISSEKTHRIEVVEDDE